MLLSSLGASLLANRLEIKGVLIGEVVMQLSQLVFEQLELDKIFNSASSFN